MKSRVLFLMGLLTVFISYFAILILSYAQTDVPELVNAQDVIKKAFPNSKITWSKEIRGEMVNFRATSTALAIMIGNGDKRKMRFINFRDTTEWSIDFDKISCRQYDIVGGEEPKLLIRGFKHGIAKTKVINTQGEEIFDLTLESWLLPSPSGRYYYTADNMDSYNVLGVYDSGGTLLWERKEYQGGEWFSHALSDSELIYEDKTGCYLLNSYSGEKIWTTPTNQYRNILTWFKSIHIICSSNAKYFVLYNGSGLVSFSSGGRVLWQEKAPVTVFSAAISDDGRYVSVYSGEKIDSPEKELRLMDNLLAGKTLWRVSVKTERKDLTNSAGGLEMEAGIVRLIPGIVDYRFRRGMAPNISTFCYEIDRDTGELLKEFVLPGAAEISEDENQTRHFLLLETTPDKETYEIFEVLVE